MDRGEGPRSSSIYVIFSPSRKTLQAAAKVSPSEAAAAAAEAEAEA